jgi:hypothetical protein
MFCPECKAEFRYGFTKCSDCGVALVDVPSSTEERFSAIRTTAPIQYDELLTRTKDPRFARAEAAIRNLNRDLDEDLA